jgi:transaldolase
MKMTQQLHDLGQSLWLDNITRELLTNGTLQNYIHEFSVTGLTSNPTIFEKAIKDSDLYDADILQKTTSGKSGEALFYELAIDDLTQAADLFSGVFDATHGMDGWASLEVSPLLANDTAGSTASAAQLYARAKCPNLFIKLPGTPAGIPAIEESIFAGVPINVTLLFSSEQYIAAAEAYMRGIERRIAAGLDPKVASVASVFISRWDVAIQERAISEHLRNRLGISIARRAYKSYLELLDSPRWKKLRAAGAQTQRLLWASTGTKDPQMSDTFYIEALAAPDTINTMPEKTLRAFAEHGQVKEMMPADGGDAEKILAAFGREGINVVELAAQLQREGTVAFSKSWKSLLDRINEKSLSLKRVRRAG